MENWQDLLTQTGQENEQLIKFKENMAEKLQKTEGENRG